MICFKKYRLLGVLILFALSIFIAIKQFQRIAWLKQQQLLITTMQSKQARAVNQFIEIKHELTKSQLQLNHEIKRQNQFVKTAFLFDFLGKQKNADWLLKQVSYQASVIRLDGKTWNKPALETLIVQLQAVIFVKTVRLISLDEAWQFSLEVTF